MKEFVYSAVCLTKGPYPLPKPVLQTVRSSASFFNFQHPLFPLRSFNGLLPLSPRLSFTSIFHSLMCYKRQFLRKAQSIQLAFLLFMVCRTFLSSLNEGLVSWKYFNFLSLRKQNVHYMLRHKSLLLILSKNWLSSRNSILESKLYKIAPKCRWKFHSHNSHSSILNAVTKVDPDNGRCLKSYSGVLSL